MREEHKEVSILAERIYESRKGLGITQEVLAEKLGITPQSVSRWENGQSRPDVDMLPRLAAFFGITVDALFGYQAENLKIAQYKEISKQKTFQTDFVSRSVEREILGLLPPVGTKNILEIGCGDGQSSVFFARNGYVVSAFDIDENAVENSKALAKNAGVDVNFFCADILNYKLDEEFDVIYAGDVVQFIPPKDRGQIFKMLQSHTKIGGLNVINAVVKKSFIDNSPALTDAEHFYKTAELFGYYGCDWKFEFFKEIYLDSNDDENARRVCMDVMIARRIV